MSLKMFHLVFIAAAVLLALFCAAMAVQALRLTPSGMTAVALAGSLTAAVALVRYEAAFLRRCRERGIE